MKKIYTVICYKIPNADNGIPDKDAGNLYFVIETFKAGCNIKAEMQYKSRNAIYKLRIYTPLRKQETGGGAENVLE